MSRRLRTLPLVLLVGCTVSNPPPPAYYPPPPPPPQQPAPAPAPQPQPVAQAQPAPQPQPMPAEQPTLAAGADANAPCIDGAGDISNEFDGAAPLPVPSTTVVCSGKRDPDVFAITAPGSTGASLITYEVRQLTDEKNAAKVTLFDGNRKKESDHNGRPAEHIRGYAVLQAGTTMYLRLAQVHMHEGKFALILTSTPLDDAHEPNDTRETARPLSGPTRALMYRALNNKDSTSDWYTFEVANPGPVNVTIDMSEDVAAKLQVADANRKVLGRKNGGKSERLEWSFKAKKAGTHHIEVASVHGLRAAARGEAPSYLTRPYVLTVTQ